MIPADPVKRMFLERTMVARVATLSPRGRPAMTPLWFVVHRGRLYLGTGRGTVIARNAAVNPEVTVLFDVGRPDCMLRVRGRARVHDGAPSAAVLLRMACKYYVAGWRSELRNARKWGLRTRYYSQAEGVTIEIDPARAELVPVP
ncbi:pyridoxamine 5'-phosphate oxidase family protein [Rhodococcus chondri]|uniref:Pyridoxamine 5'-phosphate oxidase family protein n=1 Tax=Rhodococcus chondri TaxID=3065941 RepID=A0ABU7JRI8_9NOCA|nr:pyridoxamine 5'-phosphate oxidase family protein [Rhodococcus sp. CC-R104]MEE2032440.1 pyridoxamine 5'-phosphate oxidase family protein [Rhodococcus sp. CC-R104]